MEGMATAGRCNRTATIVQRQCSIVMNYEFIITVRVSDLCVEFVSEKLPAKEQHMTSLIFHFDSTEDCI